jgi:hypothetical protein
MPGNSGASGPTTARLVNEYAAEWSDREDLALIRILRTSAKEELANGSSPRYMPGGTS